MLLLLECGVGFIEQAWAWPIGISRELRRQACGPFVRRGPQGQQSGVVGSARDYGAPWLEDIWQVPSLSLRCLICKMVTNNICFLGVVVGGRGH